MAHCAWCHELEQAGLAPDTDLHEEIDLQARTALALIEQGEALLTAIRTAVLNGVLIGAARALRRPREP